MTNMKRREYLGHLTELGSTKVGASDILGISRRQAQRLAASAPIPGPVAKLLRLMKKYGIAAKEVAEL